MRDLIGTVDGATYFAEQLWGLALRYDLGEDHPLAGCSAPDFEFDDGSRLAHELRGGAGLLVDFGASGPLRDLAAAWDGRIAYLGAGAKDTCGLAALLVRPDGVVAWASDDVPEVAGARRAATRWFGAPTRS